MSSLEQMHSVELFAGIGGLALGISNAGFEHRVLIERDKDACATIRKNQSEGLQALKNWPLCETDVRDFDYSLIGAELDLLSAGPPCQPFSIGGKHGGFDDQRDMFPQVVDAVYRLRPRAFIVENVRGLLRRSFARYFAYIYYQLSYPEMQRHPHEDWLTHLARLEQHHTHGRDDGLSYNVVFRQLNAADYGVPQKRERVFIVGFRSDLGIEWSFPNAIHSQESLLWSQWVSGEYWERHAIGSKQRTELANSMKVTVKRLKSLTVPPETQPWLTVRDAIANLPDPEKQSDGSPIFNHNFIPGARVYPGHTGSSLDEPAKTLKAGDHGVPGGENMIAYPDGRVRYFTVRESARLQTFPDEYIFPGSWTESMRQLGNAVPVKLAGLIAASIREKLECPHPGGI